MKSGVLHQTKKLHKRSSHLEYVVWEVRLLRHNWSLRSSPSRERFHRAKDNHNGLGTDLWTRRWLKHKSGGCVTPQTKVQDFRASDFGTTLPVYTGTSVSFPLVRRSGVAPGGRRLPVRSDPRVHACCFTETGSRCH